MALYFEGERQFDQSAQALWEKLSDARFLAGCVPDVESVTKAEPADVVCRLRPSFGFVRGTLDLTLHVAEAEPAQRVRLLLNTRGIGTSSAVDVYLGFEPIASGTQLRWAVNVRELGGLLKAVPEGLLKAAAQKVISDAWAGVAAKLGAQGA
jgi:carbon monoxide dehydrogenase subunit G